MIVMICIDGIIEYRETGESVRTKTMNKNALKSKSTIRVRKTNTGAVARGVGFPSTMEGTTMPREEYHALLKANGYDVEETKYGVFISRREGVK